MPLIYTGGIVDGAGIALGRVDRRLLGLKSCSTWCRSLRAPGCRVFFINGIALRAPPRRL